MTAIGEVPNVASRIEAANKEVGTRLLISQATYDEVKNYVEVADYVRVRLRGTTDRITLYEIEALTPDARTQLCPTAHETVYFAGKIWFKALPDHELSCSEWRIIEFDDLDVVIARLADDTYHAFSNACPHLHLPLFERRSLKEGDLGINTNTGLPRPLCSDFTDDRGIVCR